MKHNIKSWCPSISYPNLLVSANLRISKLMFIKASLSSTNLFLMTVIVHCKSLFVCISWFLYSVETLNLILIFIELKGSGLIPHGDQPVGEDLTT